MPPCHIFFLSPTFKIRFWFSNRFSCSVVSLASRTSWLHQRPPLPLMGDSSTEEGPKAGPAAAANAGAGGQPHGVEAICVSSGSDGNGGGRDTGWGGGGGKIRRRRVTTSVVFLSFFWKPPKQSHAAWRCAAEFFPSFWTPYPPNQWRGSQALSISTPSSPYGAPPVATEPVSGGIGSLKIVSFCDDTGTLVRMGTHILLGPCTLGHGLSKSPGGAICMQGLTTPSSRCQK